MNKPESASKYILSLHSTQQSCSVDRLSPRQSPSVLASPIKLTRELSAYDITVLSAGSSPLPKSLSQSSSMKLSRVLRQHKLYQKKYALVPDYIESAKHSIQVQRQLMEGASVCLSDPAKQCMRQASLHGIDAKAKQKRQKYVAPMPSQPKKQETESKLFEQRQPRKSKHIALSPLCHSKVLNDELMYCGQMMASGLNTQRQASGTSLTKFLRLTRNQQAFTRHYKDFKKLMVPTQQIQRQVHVVAGSTQVAAENPFQKNVFYRMHIRKDSAAFTEKFVRAFLENGRLTFNGYLSYHRLFISRTASHSELNDYIVRFFTSGSDSPTIEVREIRDTVCLLCQNADAFGEIRQYEESLESNLIKTLLGKLADQVTDKHLLLVSSLHEALRLSANTAEVIFVLMFTQNPHSIPRPEQ